MKFLVGLDNRSRETALPEGALRACSNLDVTRDGSLLVRQGLREVATGNTHSFFSHPSGRYAVFVKDGNLTHLDDTGESVLASVHPTARMRYALLNDEIYYTNGHTQGRITAQGVATFWGLPTPPGPVCSAATSGAMRAGTVRVTYCAVVDGVESGAPEPAVITVPEGGGVQITVPTGASFAVYATEVDGSVFRHAVTLASGATAIIGAHITGKPLESLFAVKPLPGQSITTHKGRLWVASGSVVWFTDERSPHWLFPHQGYYAFEGDSTALASAEDGLYVGTPSRLFFLQGNNPLDMTLRMVSTLGMLPGSGTDHIPTDVLLGQGSFPSKCCAFLDSEGVFCIGRPGGIVQRITADRFVAGSADRAEIAYWTHNGLRQFSVALMDAAQDANRALDGLVQATFANGTSLA